MRWIFIVPLLSAACGPRVPAPVTLASGVRVEFQAGGDGPPLEEGDAVLLHYDASLADGTLFDSSRSREEPFVVHLAPDSSVIPGLREGLARMAVHGRARIVIAPQEAYGEYGKGQVVPPDATVVYDVEVLERFERTQSGLLYRFLDRQEGVVPAEGDTVVVQHTARFPRSGREAFSTRSTGRPLEFVVGHPGVLPGLDEAVRRMTPGSRLQAIVPPELAFGKQAGLPLVPPDCTLWFDLELLGIRPAR